jgi:excisionase family DNA binding protein
MQTKFSRSVVLNRRASPAARPPDADRFFPLTELAVYSGLSVRRLRDYLHDSIRPLPHYRIGGKILVRRSDFDAWASGFRISAPKAAVDDVVDQLVQGLE